MLTCLIIEKKLERFELIRSLVIKRIERSVTSNQSVQKKIFVNIWIALAWALLHWLMHEESDCITHLNLEHWLAFQSKRQDSSTIQNSARLSRNYCIASSIDHHENCDSIAFEFDARFTDERKQKHLDEWVTCKQQAWRFDSYLHFCDTSSRVSVSRNIVVSFSIQINDWARLFVAHLHDTTKMRESAKIEVLDVSII